MVTTYANQSVTIQETLDALADLLQKASGFHSERVVLWHGDNRPELSQGRSVIWYRLLGSGINNTLEGPNRHGMRADLQIEVNLTTRSFRDQSQKDKYLVYQHLTTHLLLQNATLGRILHRTYEDIPEGSLEPPMPVDHQVTPSQADLRRRGESGGSYQLVSIAAITAAQLPKPDRPRPEEGYIETRFGLTIPVVLRLTLNDALPPETP